MPNNFPPDPEATKLSKRTTIAQYKAMKLANDRQGLGSLLVERFDERYFAPALTGDARHGFTQMAVGCLVIETLECFYKGLGDSKNASKSTFRDFFKRGAGLDVFGAGEPDWFFRQVRCGILHQAEVVGGWRILRSGPLLDYAERTINSKRFLEQLRGAVASYVAQMQFDDDLYAKYCKKMDAVCANCMPAP